MKTYNKNRWFDMINIKSYEVKMAIFISLVFIIMFFSINFYKDFNAYVQLLSSILSVLIGALIGLLGFSLSGIAIVAGFFNKSQIKCIDNINEPGLIQYILSEYSFFAKNIAFQCVASIGIYFLVSSDVTLVSQYIFWPITFLEIYHIFFILFYTVALVRNIVKLYEIKNIYEDIVDEQKGFWNVVNEVKIDFILSTLIQNYNCNLDDVVKEMISFIDNSELSNKEKIIDYIREQYGK